MAEEKKINTVAEYIDNCPAEIQEKLRAVRNAIMEEVPEAKEKIAWGMPSFSLNGYIIHFAANKYHVGIYPGSSGIEAFEDKLKDYKTSKGAVQFPYDKPIPLELIKEIVRFKVKENNED